MASTKAVIGRLCTNKSADSSRPLKTSHLNAGRRSLLTAGRITLLLTAVAVGIVLLLAAVPLKQAGIWVPGPFDHIVTIASPSALLAYGLLALEQQRDVRFPTPLVALGDASYSVYLVHYVLIDAFSTVWPQVGSSYALVAWSAACACIIPFVCVGVYNFIEKPLFTGLRNQIIKRIDKRAIKEEAPGISCNVTQ